MPLTGAARCQLPSVTTKPAMLCGGKTIPGTARNLLIAVNRINKSCRVGECMRMAARAADRLAAIRYVKMTICAKQPVFFVIFTFDRLLLNRGVRFDVAAL